MNNRITRDFNTNANMVTVSENGRKSIFSGAQKTCASCGMWQNGICCCSRSSWFKTPTTSVFSCNSYCG